MSNEHKPLLSERQLIDKFRVKPDEAPDGYAHGIAAVNTAIYVRDIYEAERAKDRELLAEVLRLAQKMSNGQLGASEWTRLMRIAAKHGITPTDQ